LSEQAGAVLQLAPVLASNALIMLLKFSHLKTFAMYLPNYLLCMITSGGTWKGLQDFIPQMVVPLAEVFHVFGLHWILFTF
jgi:hypothetical protein